MKIQNINKFGQKLMVSSKSINKIPYEYLSYAQNLRIYDGGIGPRKGFERIFDGQGKNQGGFSLNGFLYQVEGGKIYKLENNTRVEIATLGHSEKVDILVYQNTRGSFTSLGTENFTYDAGSGDIVSLFRYDASDKSLYGYDFSNNSQTTKTFSNDNTGYGLPAIKVLNGGSPTFTTGATDGFRDASGVILTDGQYVRPDSYIQTGNFDIQVGYYTTNEKAIIASNGQQVKVFDGVSVSSVSIDNTGIIEYSSGRSWLSAKNVLFASRPVTLANPEYAYDFTGTGAYNILYDSEIQGLKSTLGGLYVFTKELVEYISADASSSGLSLPIGNGGNPINNLCIVSAGAKIFYITKKLELETVNYVPGINDAQVGKLSSQKIVNIKEFFNNLDKNQPTAFGYNNKKDNTVHFFLRTIGSQFNDVCIVYDLVNDTWDIDIGRYYGYMTEYNEDYYGFSDLNASVFKDDIGFTDDGVAIDCKGRTQNMGFNTPSQKLFLGFFTGGALTQATTLGFTAYIDEEEVFDSELTGTTTLSLGGVGSKGVGQGEIGGESFADYRKPFIIEANEGRIWQYGDRFMLEFQSESEIQDWILDSLGIRLEMTNHTLIENVF